MHLFKITLPVISPPSSRETTKNNEEQQGTTRNNKKNNEERKETMRKNKEKGETTRNNEEQRGTTRNNEEKLRPCASLQNHSASHFPPGLPHLLNWSDLRQRRRVEKVNSGCIARDFGFSNCSQWIFLPLAAILFRGRKVSPPFVATHWASHPE